MVVALFALSLVMIVGGIAAMVQGFPYVRLESGLAMVVGGATAASSGVILLGLSAVVARLGRIAATLAELPLSSAAPGSAEAPPVPLAPTARAQEQVFSGEHRGEEHAVSDDRQFVLAATAALAGMAANTTGAPRRSEPVFEPAPAPASSEVEPPLPDLLPPEPSAPAHDRPHDRPEAQAVPAAAAEHGLFEAAPGGHEGAEPQPTPPPAPAEAARASEPAIAEPAPEQGEAEHEAREREVVGTYASGGNTYVMYADGSIEAETPRGRFSFDSLDELKAFVDAGGEGEARGAA